MPPNKKGGKNYKKGKHADDTPIIYERLEDQMYARVLKILGNCNILVFCNDGRERICHIRGNMRKKVWINVGDIVLISIRDFGKEEAGKIGKGDVCAKYDSSVILKLRQKDTTINPSLFNNIESIESDARKNQNIDEEGFDFEEASGNEEVDSDDDIKNKLNRGVTHYSNRLAQRVVNNDSDNDNDDINIDDI
jgi:translation initiation factor 1A